MSPLTFELKQRAKHNIAIPAGTEKTLREPITDLKGRISIMLSRVAKGAHHRKGISLKPRPKGSYEIRGTVQPGSNNTCREFVAQVHTQLDPAVVYARWQNPPTRPKKQVVDPPLSKASNEALRHAAQLPSVTAFNFNAFWRNEAHFDEALGCLVAEDLKDGLVNGEAFRIAVRMVLEERGLKPTSLELARSLSTLSRMGLVESIGNTSPFKFYRLSRTVAVREEEVATIAEHIETKAPQGKFVLQRFWQRNPRALETLRGLIVEHVSDGRVTKNQLGQAIHLVLQEFGGTGDDKQVGNSLQALNIMGVIEQIAADKANYCWRDARVIGGSNQRKPWIKTPLIKAVGLAAVIDELVKIAKGDEHLLDKDVLYDKLRGLYVDRTGNQPTKTTIGHAVHRLFQDGVLEARGLNNARSYHLSRSIISDSATRTVVAPKEDTFSGPLPLTEILKALTEAAGSRRCLQVRVAIEIVSKTTKCDEDRALGIVDELVKNAYLFYSKGRDLCSYKVTAKTDQHLTERSKAATVQLHEQASAPIGEAAVVFVAPQRQMSLSADARTIGDVTPSNGLSQLSRVITALRTIDSKIVSEQERMASAQVAVTAASEAIAELEEDKRQLTTVKAALEQAAKDAATLTAKYAV